ncbi:hypothetical protein BDN70DRAFT_887296, partial [Pholiota conissans]
PLMSLAPPPAHRYPHAQCEPGSNNSLPLSLVASSPSSRCLSLVASLSPPRRLSCRLAVSPSHAASISRCLVALSRHLGSFSHCVYPAISLIASDVLALSRHPCCYCVLPSHHT